MPSTSSEKYTTTKHHSETPDSHFARFRRNLLPSPQPKQLPSQAFNDVLARMMQAEVNEGGPPPATPSDTPVEVISQIHMAEPKHPTPEFEDTMQSTKKIRADVD